MRRGLFLGSHRACSVTLPRDPRMPGRRVRNRSTLAPPHTARPLPSKSPTRARSIRLICPVPPYGIGSDNRGQQHHRAPEPHRAGAAEAHDLLARYAIARDLRRMRGSRRSCETAEERMRFASPTARNESPCLCTDTSVGNCQSPAVREPSLHSGTGTRDHTREQGAAFREFHMRRKGWRAPLG